MMVEFLRQHGTRDDQRTAGLHAGENAGAPRGEPLIERIAECVDLAEQAEHLVIGGDEAGDDHVVGDAEFSGAGMKLLLDLVDAANEGADIDEQRLEPALLQNGADLEQRIGLLARIDRSEMTDQEPPVTFRGDQAMPQFRIFNSDRGFDVRRQRRQHALFGGPAEQADRPPARAAPAART